MDFRKVIHCAGESVGTLPRSDIIGFGDRVTYDLPSQLLAHPSECACLGVAVDDQVVRLVCNDKILAVATDRYLPAKKSAFSERLDGIEYC